MYFQQRNNVCGIRPLDKSAERSKHNTLVHLVLNMAIPLALFSQL